MKRSLIIVLALIMGLTALAGAEGIELTELRARSTKRPCARSTASSRWI